MKKQAILLIIIQIYSYTCISLVSSQVHCTYLIMKEDTFLVDTVFRGLYILFSFLDLLCFNPVQYLL